MATAERSGAGTSEVTNAITASYPSYASTRGLDELRAAEYPALARHTYLDFTAGNLYATSQLTRHLELLQRHLLGNPHSTNPASAASTEFVARARRAVLRFFNASPDDWEVVFTANATQALKLIGESYPFGPGDRFLLTFDNHNSVNGIREFARAHGATASYVPVVLPDMRVDETDLVKGFATRRDGGHNLFAYPAQSNFSGVQHPLEWIARAQAHGWDVLLDAAAFTATNTLDLGTWTPDFVVQSFYKLFGYPTGVGCLLARKSALAKLRRPWFSGGTITVASVQGDKYYLAEGPSAFEDGTLDYLSIPAIEIGLQHISAIGLSTIHERVRCLTAWLLDQLVPLTQTNGQPLIRLYGPPNTDRRGAIVTFNFYGADGRAIDHRLVERLANAADISLRTGCFCNPGGGEVALGLTGTELSSCFRQSQHATHFTVDDFRLCIDGKSTGAVRVSLGMVSDAADVDRFITFAKGFIGR
ncbi:MAG TPA: aminotransferase class V-fold PLP-dependent enzyme [Vicinamibacterales bacterium]|nr:aminotransferase class V-fold PLP-dependent enzyme [Vicinamibacterales bacterium]